MTDKAASSQGIASPATGVSAQTRTMLWILLTSFKPRNDVLGSTLLFTPTLDAYQAVITPALLTALQQSIVIAASSTAVGSV